MSKNTRRHGWEPVIGLEIHAELNTKSKLFGRARNHFGDDPNTNIDELSVGLPGALPVINKEAVRKAVQFGLAVNAEIALWSRFERKSYFYPDSPRNFQITQFEFPVSKGGVVTALVDGHEREFHLTRTQLEDDSGMLKHFTSFAGVDFNRAGVPLIEIVSEPCIRSAKEASAYAMAVRSILDYIEASDCNMEEGSIRFDVNISVRKVGEKGFRNKTEIKNMNSFSNLEMAIEHEIDRQIEIYEGSPDIDHTLLISQSTVRWDPELKQTVLMRKKEAAEDYRYFPEPDLPPLVLNPKYIEEIRATLPELPLAKERRFVQTLGLSPAAAYLVTSDKKLAHYFEDALKVCPDSKQVANWITIEFFGRLKDTGKSIYESGILAEHIGELVLLISSGKITGKIAKSVADDMFQRPGVSPRLIVESNPDYQPTSDQGQLQLIIDEVLKENLQSVVDYRAGRDRAFAFLIGQVMKRTRGTASPQIVNQLLSDSIKKVDL